MRDLIEQKVREAEDLAAKSQDGSATQQGWMRVATSWRLIAKRAAAESMGEEDLAFHTFH